MLKHPYCRQLDENRVCLQFFACTIWMLISASGTRIPPAVGPRLKPAGSPLDTHFPQESHTRSN